jgi:type VI secretion system secreted protein VgrG
MLLPKILFAGLLIIVAADSASAGAIPVDLGAAAGFAVLAGSAVTSTGDTVVDGNLGIWPSAAVTGFPSGVIMNGNLYAGDTIAMQAQAGLMSAYQQASDETGAQSLTGQDLGGMTLDPGIYAFLASAQLTGTLTLDAAHISNAVFIFQIASTLNTASGAVVHLLNFAPGDQVIWQVGSSATLGSGTAFAGDLLVLTSITLDAGAGVTCGGAFAVDGAISLQDNSISMSGAACPSEDVQVAEPSSLALFLTAILSVILGKRWFSFTQAHKLTRGKTLYAR